MVVDAKRYAAKYHRFTTSEFGSGIYTANESMIDKWYNMMAEGTYPLSITQDGSAMKVSTSGANGGMVHGAAPKARLPALLGYEAMVSARWEMKVNAVGPRIGMMAGVYHNVNCKMPAACIFFDTSTGKLYINVWSVANNSGNIYTSLVDSGNIDNIYTSPTAVANFAPTDRTQYELTLLISKNTAGLTAISALLKINGRLALSTEDSLVIDSVNDHCKYFANDNIYSFFYMPYVSANLITYLYQYAMVKS